MGEGFHFQKANVFMHNCSRPCFEIASLLRSSQWLFSVWNTSIIAPTEQVSARYAVPKQTAQVNTHTRYSAMPKKGFTYITTNDNHTVLYTGATSTLKDRIDRHRNKKYKNAFTGRYNVYKLVWFQEFEWIGDALAREKQIKAGSRKKKIALINAMNPEWRDLYEELDE